MELVNSYVNLINNYVKFKFFRPFFKERGPINILIKGIECMNDDPAEVNVLYAIIIDEDGHLQNLFEQIADYFVERGKLYCENKTTNFKITLNNSKFFKTSVLLNSLKNI